MKKILIFMTIFVLFFVFAPLSLKASVFPQAASGGFMMMDRDEWETMEQFMDRMHEGDLSSEDQQEMWQLMNENGTVVVPGSNGNFMMSPGMMGGSWGGFFWTGWITMVLVWILLILGIIALVRWLSRQGR